MRSTNSPRIDELMTTTEAAEYLGIAPDRLKRWPIPYYQLGARGHRLYARRDIAAVIAAARREPTAELDIVGISGPAAALLDTVALEHDDDGPMTELELRRAHGDR